MIEQMKIGVSLNLIGDANPKLKDFRSTVQRTSQAVEMLEARLRPVSDSMMRISDYLSKLNPQMRLFSEQTSTSTGFIKGLNATLKTGKNEFASFDRSLLSTSRRMENLSRNASMLKGEMASVAIATHMASSAALIGGNNGGGNGGNNGGMHLRGSHFGPIGFTGAAIGVGMLGLGVKAGFDQSASYQQALAQFSVQNLPGGSAAQADSFIRNQKIKGVSNLQLAQSLSDAAVITKDAKESMAIAPILAKINFANRAVYGGSNAALSHSQEQALIKTAEIVSGSKDVSKIYPDIEAMVKVGTSTSGRVKPADFLALARGARGALYGADPNFVYYTLESLVQEYGGASVGKMVAQASNHIVAGRMTTASAKDFQSFGLVKPGAAEFNKVGMIKRVKPGGIVGQDVFHNNMADWFYNIYLPALQKHGVTSYEEQRKHILIDFTNTDSTLFSALLAQRQKITTNVAYNKRAAGVNELVQKAYSLPTGQKETLSASYGNFKQALGDLTGNSVQGGMQAIEKTLDFFTWLLNATDKFLTFTGKFGNLLPSFEQIEATANKAVEKAAPLFDSNNNVSKASQGTTIQIHMDGRAVAQALVPHQNQSMYHTQIQQSNNFMTGMTPIQPNTGVPYR